MKKVLTLIEWGIFAVLIIFVLLVASSLLPTKDILSSYVVASGSMEPTLQTGAIVFTTKVDPKTISKGEIVTFTEPTNPKNIIVHRVIAVQSNHGLSFTTKGDHNKVADSWTVNPSEIKGKTLFSIPYLGYAVAWFKTPVGFAISIGVPALLLIYLQAKKIKEGIDEEVEKRTKEALQRHNLSEGAKALILVLIMVGVCFALPSTKSYADFSTAATVSGITLVVGSTTPVTPTPTPTVTPTPSGNGCNVTIEGNGAGSNNTATCSTSNNTTVNQISTTSSSTTTIIKSNTGGNSADSNTGTDQLIQTGSVSATVQTQTTSGVNIASGSTQLK